MILLFVVLGGVVLLARRRGRELPPGTIVGIFVLYYGIARCLSDSLRVNDERIAGHDRRAVDVHRDDPRRHVDPVAGAPRLAGRGRGRGRRKPRRRGAEVEAEAERARSRGRPATAAEAAVTTMRRTGRAGTDSEDSKAGPIDYGRRRCRRRRGNGPARRALTRPATGAEERGWRHVRRSPHHRRPACRRWRSPPWWLLLGLAAAACGDDDDDASSDTTASPRRSRAATAAVRHAGGQPSSSSSDVSAPAGGTAGDDQLLGRRAHLHGRRRRLRRGGPRRRDGGGRRSPTEPGEYPFHCEIHPSMQATLTVE